MVFPTDGADAPIDLLVRLYQLPEALSLREQFRARSILVRRAMAYEKDMVVDWVSSTFGQTAPGWRSECDIAFSRVPIACQIAVRSGAIIGFACYDATARGVFGPIGVAGPHRLSGVGRLLLLSALESMRSVGYAYAVIGAAGPVGFFVKSVGASPIQGSSPGIYSDFLTRD